MPFIRKFNNFNFQKMAQEKIYQYIEPEIRSGKIFPALRPGRIDFYYNGGCIYRYRNKGFYCNPNYRKHFNGKSFSFMGEDEYYIDSNSDINFALLHSDLKKAIESKFPDKAERSYLNHIYTYTYSREDSETKVIDIEVWINHTKCDMVLWDSKTKEVQFVEAKLYDDDRLWKKGHVELDTLEQVQKYDNAIKENYSNIILQYQNYIAFMKQFGLKVDKIKGIKGINPSAKLVKLVIFDVNKARFNNHQNKTRKEKINSLYKEKLDKNLYLCFDTPPKDITPDLVFNGHYDYE